MKKYVDLLFKSMVAHDPFILPLADSYAATENSEPAALGAMSCWRTVTGLNCIGQCIIDKAAGQIFVTANLAEGGMPSVFYGRLKIENETISELELYIDRAPVDSGFIFKPEEMNTLPKGWTSPIPADGRATREELLAVGKAIFDNSTGVEYESSEDCILMEIGGIVYEDPEYLEGLNFDGKGNEYRSQEKVTIPAGLAPARPTDPKARVAVIDEEQGIVVSFAVVHGYVAPYVVTKETGSCFVPAQMIEMHRGTLKPEMFKGRKVAQEMPASATTVEILRFHSGKVQGMHRYINLQGPGASTPWVAK
ncbi:MAG: hypothetical protein H6Q74_757 [Firmicutes bacterium]|nr:hypothetical protein [Bacillota bacterium]